MVAFFGGAILLYDMVEDSIKVAVPGQTMDLDLDLSDGELPVVVEPRNEGAAAGMFPSKRTGA